MVAHGIPLIRGSYPFNRTAVSSMPNVHRPT